MPKNWCFWTVMLEKTLESPLKSTLNTHWKDWCWNWRSNTLATWCEELKRPWCWERLKAGGKGDDRKRDGWMATLTQWTWVWASPSRWWRTGKPGVLKSMGLQTDGRDWATEQLEETRNCSLLCICVTVLLSDWTIWKLPNATVQPTIL